MNKSWLVVLTVLLLSVQGYCEDTAQAPKEFGGIVTDVKSMSAVVESIDYATRDITLKNTEGKELTVKAGPEVRNFDQIKKGDKVNADYVQSVKILVNAQTSTPARLDTLEVARAPLGAKPAGVVTAATQVLAKVTDIDYQKRTVIVEGPLRKVTVKVDESDVNFDNLKVGDTVYLEYVAQLAIAVTK